MAKVSIKTLYHYDEIGLLKPQRRSESGYRYYGRGELIQLQQILLYREIDLPLKEIKVILKQDDFNPLKALKWHRIQLLQKLDRMQRLLQTIDLSIAEQSSKSNLEKMKTEDLYEGFRKEEAEAYRNEAKKRWPKEFESSEAKLKGMDKKDFEALKNEGIDLMNSLAKKMSLPIEHKEVQEIIGQYHQHLSKFTPIDKERYNELGKMYVDDERFTAYYEKIAPGLANYLQKAIGHYCA